MKIQIAPSLLACDFAAIGAECRAMECAGADILHVDVMDGHFVKNLSMGPAILKSLRRHTGLALDVHLMVSDPAYYANAFIDAGADILSFHIEACADPMALLHAVQERGVRAGLVLKPGTPLETALPFLNTVDLVTVMTVEPGFGGQSFMEDMLPKIAALRCLRVQLDIEVDGGINLAWAGPVVCAGANVLVAGSSLFGAADYTQAVSDLREAAHSGIRVD